MAIKNIVFDVGNVLVRWDPQGIVERVFDGHANLPQLMQEIFKHETWLLLNRGEITEVEAIDRYHQLLKIDKKHLQHLVNVVKDSLTPIEESIALLENLSHQEFKLYALTDNTHEIMAYLRKRYQFWDHFQGVIVSAEVGYLKPAKEIYEILLSTYQLIPEETVFIDDVPRNVEGAKALGIHGIVFEEPAQCIAHLKKLGVIK